jgi:hypothetical protein
VGTLDTMDVPQALYLSIAWFFREPHRTGPVARLDRGLVFGRAVSDHLKTPLLRFSEDRPGASLGTPVFESTTISHGIVGETPEGR